MLADNLVREMHKMTLTVDLSDENFAGNSSGQALKLKLLSMDLLARGKMRRMECGLRERMALYSHWLTVRGASWRRWTRIRWMWCSPPTCPSTSEKVDLVCKLQNIVDDQTLLSQLWFIRDPAEAAENLRRQREERGGGG